MLRDEAAAAFLFKLTIQASRAPQGSGLTAFVPLPSHHYHQITGRLKIQAITSVLGLKILAWLY